MSQELMDMQMHFLESHINEEVSCVFWELGVCKEIKGKLSVVVPYDRVAVGGYPLPFVGTNSAIEKIDIGNKTVYLCPKANGYKGCLNYDHFALVGAQMELLDRSIKLDVMNQKFDSAPPEMKKYK